MRSVLRVLGHRPLLANVKSKLAVATTLLVALTICVYALWHSPQQVYGLEDLPKKLLEIKSIYLTGWIFEPASMLEPGQKSPAKKYPVKIFAERPDCSWHTTYGFSGPDLTRKVVEVRSGYVAAKGRRHLYVSNEDKKAFEESIPASQNELSTETLIQTQLPVLNGNLRDFARKGTETVNNIRCDVYERFFKEAQRKDRLWLDPKTGLPVRMASYDIDEAGHETFAHLIDHVEVNISADATSLSFDPPAGYEVAQSKQTRETNLLNTGGSCSNDDVELGVWQCFNIDDKAALLCWYHERQPGSKEGDAKVPVEFLLAGIPSDHIEIATAEDSGHHWNWSLAFPQKVGGRIGSDLLTVAHHPKKGGSLTMDNMPLRLSEERLNAILVEIQRFSKTTVLGSSQPFTLETLRAKIAERR